MLRNRRLFFVGIGVCVFLFFISSSTILAAGTFPDHEILIVVWAGVGGGADRQSRAVQRFLPDILNVSVIVENHKGAGGKIGASYYLKKPRDGYSILAFHQPMLTTIIKNNPGFATLNSFAYINANWIDPVILTAHKDMGWKTLDDMIQAAKKNPGKYSFSTSGPGTTGATVAKWFSEKLGIKFRVAHYSGGGRSRLSVKAHHTDMTATGAQRMINIKDDVVALARFWKDPIPIWPNAEYVNEALAKYNVKMPHLASVSGFMVHKEVQEKYPERWKILVNAFKKLTTEHKGFQEFCKKAAIGYLWLGPEKSLDLVKEIDAAFR